MLDYYYFHINNIFLQINIMIFHLMIYIIIILIYESPHFRMVNIYIYNLHYKNGNNLLIYLIQKIKYNKMKNIIKEYN